MDYLLHLSIFICIYTSLAQSLNLAAGKTGLVSLAHAGFYGIGAYTTSLLSVHFGLSFWVNLPLSMVICATVALVVSLIALRTVEDYFIVCTLGIQVVIFSLMNNWMEITRGPLGISNIPPIQLLGIAINGKLPFLILSASFMSLIWWLLNKLGDSGFGKILVAVSEDEIYPQSIGKNVNQAKMIAFTLSATLAAVPGAMYAHYISYIDPTSFTLNESIFILSIVIIGGMGSLRGSFFASVFMVLLPETLRFVGMPDNIAANMRQIIYGLCLIGLIISGKNGLGAFVSRRYL